MVASGSHHPELASEGERFELRGKLGSGGMGAVYRALDRERGTEVALKVMHHLTGRDLYRFKREFRTLADFVHPNLVTLHELHTVGDEWFLTMEYVDGVPFIDYVRVPTRLHTPQPFPALQLTSRSRDDDSGSGGFDKTAPTRVTPAQLHARQRIIEAELKYDRLQDALYQLCDTVHALHQTGKLHRDLKPSNVLVEDSGRVVLLDFGLVSDVATMSAELTHEAGAVGTPSYMSPEQAADRPLSPASDWYSVGVMLYEALTGRRPLDVLGEVPPGPHGPTLPRPARYNPGVPAHLERLCLDLLKPDPEHRPDGAHILAALGREPSEASRLLLRGLAAAPFVGRQHELGVLRAALAERRPGHAVLALVRGGSGMGKTALLRRFADALANDPDTVLLRGRCYERESVPFKTLDTVVDALTAYLLRVPPEELGKLLPREIVALARLFPVLRRLPAVAEAGLRGAQPPDPLELRRRAFGALRILLARLGAKHPVVLVIDDLQWGDVDSASVLADLLYHPEAPALLLVGSVRSEDEGASPLLAALGRARVGAGAAPPRELTLPPLPEGEARQIVNGLIHEGGVARVDALIRESGGNPLFLTELARAHLPDDEATGHVPSIEEIVHARVARLSEESRALLEVCAVAGRPTRRDLAVKAAGLAGEGSALIALRAERLLRVSGGSEGAAQLETYHDRIRASVVGQLSLERRRAISRALAQTLAAAESPDHERLVDSWLGAGEIARASEHAELAAAAAEERLAFHRAARLYQLALEHGRHDVTTRRRLRTLLGLALAHAGLVDEAAATFAAAAEGAPPDERLELERHELEQLLRGGRLSVGLVKIRQVLAAVGERLPRTQLGAILSLLVQRGLVRLRGLEFRERDVADVPTPKLRQIDALWAVASGLSFVNPIFGRVLQVKHLRAALASGEPHRIGHALAIELGYLATAGVRNYEKAEKLRARAIDIAVRVGDRNIVGLAKANGGLVSFLSGRWREAAERLGDAEKTLRDECTHMRWELDLTEIFRCGNLWFLGETRELVRAVPVYLREAEERGDVYAQRGLSAWRGNNTWLVLDRPDEARAHVIAGAMPHGPGHPTQLTHYYELLAHTHIDLYTGDAWAAHRRVEGMWRALRGAMLLRIQTLAVEAWFLRGRAALAAAAAGGGGDTRALHALAQQAEKTILAEGTPWGAPIAALLAGTREQQLGKTERAAAALRSALAGFDAADMQLYAAVTRRRLGALVGGDEGQALVKAGETFMRDQAVVAIEAMSGMFAPAKR